jgi:hypothetical protein
MTGLTIFATLKPVGLLEGRTLQEVVSGPIEGVSPKLYSAFKMAAEAILKEESARQTPSGESSADPTGVALVEAEVSGKEVTIQQ